MAEILLKVAVNTIPPLTPEKENQLYCDAKDFAAVVMGTDCIYNYHDGPAPLLTRHVYFHK
jgi:hypothetical protein